MQATVSPCRHIHVSASDYARCSLSLQDWTLCRTPTSTTLILFLHHGLSSITSSYFSFELLPPLPTLFISIAFHQSHYRRFFFLFWSSITCLLSLRHFLIVFITLPTCSCVLHLATFLLILSYLLLFLFFLFTPALIFLYVPRYHQRIVGSSITQVLLTPNHPPFPTGLFMTSSLGSMVSRRSLDRNEGVMSRVGLRVFSRLGYGHAR